MTARAAVAGLLLLAFSALAACGRSAPRHDGRPAQGADSSAAAPSALSPAPAPPTSAPPADPLWSRIDSARERVSADVSGAALDRLGPDAQRLRDLVVSLERRSAALPPAQRLLVREQRAIVDRKTREMVRTGARGDLNGAQAALNGVDQALRVLRTQASVSRPGPP